VNAAGSRVKQFVVTAPSSTNTRTHAPLSVVILGTDALLAAQPATAVQLAHACHRAGYETVLPASWGDELVADFVARRLRTFGSVPAVQCSCPLVANRLLQGSDGLRDWMISVAPPPVALARYVRARATSRPPRITYVGACAGASDRCIDIRISPTAFLELLAERGIVPDQEPVSFDSVIPPDRRRFHSHPGGAPTTDALARHPGARVLVDLYEDGELASALADHLLGSECVLVDASSCLGCPCAGAVAGVAPCDAREIVIALEPPRATTPVIEELEDLELDLPMPAAARWAADIVESLNRR
jgi:hypothetical protein